MNAAPIFLSHTHADKAIVSQIREALERQGLPVWVDSRGLTGGDDLNDEVFERIEAARHFMVVLSPPVINSTWVAKEINHAVWVRNKRTDGYKVIPILLDGVQPSALHHWFGKKEPLAARIGNGGGAHWTRETRQQRQHDGLASVSVFFVALLPSGHRSLHTGFPVSGHTTRPGQSVRFLPS